jgi:hypothetical protein
MPVGLPNEQREIAVLVCLDAEKIDVDIGPPTHAGRRWIHGSPIQCDELAPSEDREVLDTGALPRRYVVRDIGADEIRRERDLG